MGNMADLLIKQGILEEIDDADVPSLLSTDLCVKELNECVTCTECWPDR